MKMEDKSLLQILDGETIVRVLKARYKGSSTGLAGGLYYDTGTGRLRECKYTEGAF